MLWVLKLIEKGSIASDKMVRGNSKEANSTGHICMMATAQTGQGLCGRSDSVLGSRNLGIFGGMIFFQMEIQARDVRILCTSGIYERSKLTQNRL